MALSDDRARRMSHARGTWPLTSACVSRSWVLTLSFLAMLLPFGALVFGAALYSEAITARALAGAALVAVGLLIAQLTPVRRGPAGTLGVRFREIRVRD
jgi:hypothetical protein